MVHGDLKTYRDWLRNVRWQFFCTFTFAWPVSDVQAHKVFMAFMNRLEQYARGPIAFVRGDEKRYSGCGKPGAPRHFHALLVAHRKLDRKYLSDLWMSMAGRRKKGAGADVRIYDPNQGGLVYVLKFINQPGGDWAFKNLDLYLPSRGEHHQLNHRQRRRLSRHANRVGNK